jgi:thiol-disulfide isomerase/thioredoxin
MKLPIFITLTFFFMLGLNVQAQQSLPNLNAQTLDGQVVNLLDTYGGQNGKVTVFSFWATWCSPCKKELDAIADLYPDWQEEYGVELVAITIDTRRNLAKVGPMVETKGWEYTILSLNDQEARVAFNFSSIPQTFVVDKDGNIVYNHNGYVPGDEYELEDKIAELSKK